MIEFFSQFWDFVVKNINNIFVGLIVTFLGWLFAYNFRMIIKYTKWLYDRYPFRIYNKSQFELIAKNQRKNQKPLIFASVLSCSFGFIPVESSTTGNSNKKRIIDFWIELNTLAINKGSIHLSKIVDQQNSFIFDIEKQSFLNSKLTSLSVEKPVHNCALSCGQEIDKQLAEKLLGMQFFNLELIVYDELNNPIPVKFDGKDSLRVPFVSGE